MPSACKVALAALGALAIVPAAQADQAIVVGVQEYAPLVAASTLKGCINDAAALADVLAKQGFKVTFMANGEATRQKIFDAIAKSASTIKPSEKFVFYFAGHGRKAPRFAIMPSDATLEGSDIEPKQLNEAILKVNAKSRTVILDSCFSGGMSAGEMSRGMDDFESRFFEDPKVAARSVTFGAPKSQGSSSNKPDKFETAGGICYYTAALDSEQALEATMEDGKRHGLFTYGLIKNLKQGKLWSEVHNDVKKSIGKRLENSGRTQNPMISTAYMPTEALVNAKKATPPPPPGKTLLDVWNSDNPNADKIALKLKPDQDIIEAGKQLALEVKVGQEGYLVIFGQVGDKFYQFYPFEGNRAADAKVPKGTITFPSGRNKLFFDSFGADHVKAMLFTSPEKAASVMAAMAAANGRPTDAALSTDVKDNPFTSRISVAVADSLVGGSRLKNLDGLIKKVMAQGTDVDKFIYSKLKAAADGYEKGDSFVTGFDSTQQPTLADREAFVCLLNIAIQNGVLYDATAMSGAKLSDAIKKAAKTPPVGDKLWQLNRQILLALYPEEINPDAPSK